MSCCYADIADITAMSRKLSTAEQTRAKALLPAVSAELRLRAKAVGQDLDTLALDPDYAAVLKSVVVDVVLRTLNTSTTAEPLSQYSQTAGPYTVSGSYLVPGGGVYIKKSELARLGLRRQTYGGLDIYGCDTRRDCIPPDPGKSR